MDWDKCFCARPVGAVSDDIASILAARGERYLLEKLRTTAAGTWREFTEVFATVSARDAALGWHGRFAKFVPVFWEEHLEAGFDFSDIGIGHRVGEPGFDCLARQLVDATVRRMPRCDNPRSIVLARCRYFVSASHDDRITIRVMPEFGIVPDDREVEATIHWLQAAFAERLATPPTVTI